MSKHLFYRLLIVGSALLPGCDRALLDAKPDQALVIPTTLADFQALLDNTNVFNSATGMANIAADDFEITDAGWHNLSTAQERNSYLWAYDVYEGTQNIADWRGPYEQVFYCNVVLDGLAKADSTVDMASFNRIKGTALFCRAFAHYNLAQLFCAPYLDDVSGQLPGIPIRLSADVNIPSVRGTVAGTYAQIVGDLRQASALLPASVTFKSRPTRAAAFALLARVYQSSNNHEQALTYADTALELHDALLDFNEIDAEPNWPMPRILPYGNEEVLYFAHLTTYLFNLNIFGEIGPAQELYGLYDQWDLRKSLYFRENQQTGQTNYRGSFSGDDLMFNGLSCGELYLIKAESLARLNKPAEALSTLNWLLKHRYPTDNFTPHSVGSVPDVLGLVLKERRREMFGRGTRWTDLRRLNQEPGRETNLQRILDGKIYRLEPNDPRYLFPIPDLDVKAFGLIQNPR